MTLPAKMMHVSSIGCCRRLPLYCTAAGLGQWEYKQFNISWQ